MEGTQQNLPKYMREEIHFLNTHYSSYLFLRGLTNQQREPLNSGYIRNINSSTDPIQDIEQIVIDIIFTPNDIH